MAAHNGNRTAAQVRSDIESEREQLAGAVEYLRDELGEATDISGKLKSKLPVVAGAAASAGFVLAGGVGATMRYFARRGRERHETLRVGRWSILDRD
jgi:shikimate kinase